MNFSKHLTKTALAVAISHAMVVPAQAFERDVATIDDLRNAIIDANANDVADTINLTESIEVNDFGDTSGNAVPFIYSAITINGNGHTLSRVVDNDTDPANQFRIMAVFSPGGRPNDGRLVLNNITLEGGFLPSYNGGGLFVEEDTTAILNDVTISGNRMGIVGQSSGGLGAGIYSKGSLTLNNSRVSNNVASRSGGGIYSSGGTLRLNNTSISGNSALTQGGGIAVFDSAVSINQGNIIGNSVFSDFGNGGGISAIADSSLRVRNTTITENSTSLFGGGMLITDSSLDLLRSTISLNSGENGGGIYTSRSLLDIEDGTITANSAFSHGGGIFTSFARGANSVITNTTISGNSAGSLGGGLVSRASNIDIKNSTITANSTTAGESNSGAGIFATGPSVTLFNSIVANSIGDDCYSVEDNSVYADDTNIIEDGSCGTDALAVDPELRLLADNGGPTLTHALISTSPAIGLGSSGICNVSPVSRLDQRGYLRTGTCDAGAFEFGASKPPPPPPPPPFNPASIVPAVTLLIGDDEE